MSYQGELGLEQAVYDTVRYFDLFKMPVTTTQIWRALVVDKEGAGVRWHGFHVPSLRQIRGVLAGSKWLKQRVVSKWGYYCLRNSAGSSDHEVQQYVRKRLWRHALAQNKWKITRRVVRWLAPLPFVRMIGGSGSLAMFNTREESDLDLLLLVKDGRIWTARMLSLIVSHLTGRRRKWWDEVAPDKVCLNHYVSDGELVMSPDIRNIYTAQLYKQVVPLTGLDSYQGWFEANQTWIKRWLMYPEVLVMESRLFMGRQGWMRVVQRAIEGFLLELPGDLVEKWAERWQWWFIEKHTKIGQAGRVVVSKTELAFHPDTKVPGIIAKFEQEEGQGQLL